MSNTKRLVQALLGATLIAVASAMIFAFVGEWTIQFCAQIIHPRTYPPTKSLAFLPDGAPVVSIERYDPQRGFLDREHQDLNGKTLDLPNSQKYLSGAWLGAPHYTKVPSWTLQWSPRILTLQDYSPRESFYWYLLHDGQEPGAAYFVGYDVENHRRVGYFGKEGFSEEVPSRENGFGFNLRNYWDLQKRLVTKQNDFYGANYPNLGSGLDYDPKDEIPYWIIYLHADAGLYKVDFRERTVKLLEGLKGEEILNVSFVEWYDAPSDRWISRLAVQTKQAIILYNQADEVIHTLAIPETLRAETDLGLYRRKDGAYFATSSKWKSENGRNFTLAKIYDLTDAGEIQEAREVKLDYGEVQRHFAGEGLAVALTLGPLAVDGGMFLLGPIVGVRVGQFESYSAGLRDIFEEFYRGKLDFSFLFYCGLLLLCHLHGLFSGWYCWRRETKYGSGKIEKRVWTLVCLSFGLPALVGYLTHRHWPVLEACKICGSEIPADKRDCLTCGVERALPASEGIEIFA